MLLLLGLPKPLRALLVRRFSHLCTDSPLPYPTGGKKGSRWRDDVWTMKYLPKFRWDMLSEQVGTCLFLSPFLLPSAPLATPPHELTPLATALERATQTSLLRFHLQSSRTEQESYLESVEKARVKDAIVAKAEGRKKARVEGDGGDGKGEKKERERKYRQREVVEGKGGGEGLEGVLGRLF